MGFSLLEVLVAMTIAAMVAAVVLSVYRAISAASQSARSVHEGVAGAIEALQRIQRDVACAVEVPMRGVVSMIVDPGSMVEDRCSSLMLYTVCLPEGETDAARVEVRRVSYRVEPADDDRGRGSVLMREEQKLEMDGSMGEPVRETVARCVRKFQVAAYDADKWKSEWPSDTARSLPSAIRLLLVYDDGRVSRSLETDVLVRAGTIFKP